MRTRFCVFVAFSAILSAVDGQHVRETILQVLTQPSNNLTKFGEWCKETLGVLYDGQIKLTVFAYNDSSFYTMSSEDRALLTSLTLVQEKDYVMTFTVMGEYSMGLFVDNTIQRPLNGNNLFINKRGWNPGSGPNMRAVYINGGMIVRKIEASNGIVYILDRVLLPVSYKTVYSWINQPDDSSVQTTIFSDLASRLFSRFYLEALAPLSQADKITLFLPSETALRKLPYSALHSLSEQKLSGYFQMHFIPDKVVFTSYIEHQESYANGYTGTGNSAAENGRVLFMRQEDKVLVQSGGVTARIERGNITTRNGVIHIIDRMLGLVVNTALEQIEQDCPIFRQLINQTAPDVQAFISQPYGVNVFVPTDEALRRIQILPWINLDQNDTLRDNIVRLSIIKDGGIMTSQLHGNYDYRQRRVSRYNNTKLVVYNDKNETWVNGGNVRARIIRRDVKVTTGRLQYIDAVLGIPYMDIPTLIYYDDYLIATYNDLKTTGLVDYLRDPRYDPSILPPRTFGNNFYQTTVNTKQPSQPSGQTQLQDQPLSDHDVESNATCGDYDNVCRFTFFVPNGTAIDTFHTSDLGHNITRDVPRYRNVLRRFLILDEVISLEDLLVSPKPLMYHTLTGESINITKYTDNTVMIGWANMTARVIMWDLGATNGIVHIIDKVLSDSSDLDRDITIETGQ